MKEADNEPPNIDRLLQNLPNVPQTADFTSGVLTRVLMTKLPVVEAPSTFEQDVLNRLHSLPRQQRGNSYTTIIISAASFLLLVAGIWYFASSFTSVQQHPQPLEQEQSAPQLQKVTAPHTPSVSSQKPGQSPEANTPSISSPQHSLQTKTSTTTLSRTKDSLKTKHEIDATRGGKIPDDKLNEE